MSSLWWREQRRSATSAVTTTAAATSREQRRGLRWSPCRPVGPPASAPSMLGGVIPQVAGAPAWQPQRQPPGHAANGARIAAEQTQARTEIKRLRQAEQQRQLGLMFVNDAVVAAARAAVQLEVRPRVAALGPVIEGSKGDALSLREHFPPGHPHSSSLSHPIFPLGSRRWPTFRRHVLSASTQQSLG